jgi:GDP-D-mannose 3', 5'-epimerase
MKKVLVCGAGGFIGSHSLKNLNPKVIGLEVDIKYPEFSETAADDFIGGDLRDPGLVNLVSRRYRRSIST